MRRKRLACLCLGAMMALSTAGCGKKAESPSPSASGEVQKEETQKSGDKTGGKFTYWVEMNPSAATVVQNYGDIEYFKKLQEITGTQIEFMHPPAGQTTEQFKLLIASRKDLPDVVSINWLTEYPGGPEKAVKDGVIIDLNDYLDLMPNYKAFLESDPEIKKQSITDEGTLYGFHGINMEKVRTCACGLIARQDWLDDLGLEVPETIDEWENALRLFKEEKGATAPFTVQLKDFFKYNLFNAAYGITNEFYLDESGQVQYGPIQPEYKEYLTTMNRWYQEGLIDPDFASIDKKIISSNMLNDKSGVAFGFVGSGMGTWLNAATQENYALVGCPNPVLHKGDEGMFSPEYKGKVLITAAITTNAKDIESIIKTFDYLYTDEGRLLKNFGIEGMTYNMVDGKPVYSDLITHNPDGLAISDAMAKYIQPNYPGAGQANLPEYIDQYYAEESQKEANVTFNKFSEASAKYSMPPVTATADESKELGNIMSQISTYRDEKVVAFITGADSLDHFDDFVAEIKNLGIERAIEIKTASLERYQAR